MVEPLTAGSGLKLSYSIRNLTYGFIMIAVLARYIKSAPGGVAQLGERLVCTEKVAGSSPVTSTDISRA